jgi:hypothetical protein
MCISFNSYVYAWLHSKCIVMNLEPAYTANPWITAYPACQSKPAAILVIFRSRHLCCPLKNLKQDVGSGVAPSDKVLEVVKVLWPNKLQQLDLQHCTIAMQPRRTIAKHNRLMYCKHDAAAWSNDQSATNE